MRAAGGEHRRIGEIRENCLNARVTRIDLVERLNQVGTCIQAEILALLIELDRPADVCAARSRQDIQHESLAVEQLRFCQAADWLELRAQVFQAAIQDWLADFVAGVLGFQQAQHHVG